MKFQFSLRDLLILVAFLALAAGWWIDHQRINHIAVQQWEYMTTVQSTNGAMAASGTAALNKLASEGWEVCGMSGDISFAVFLLRRPVH
jgi:hypothetical protein